MAAKVAKNFSFKLAGLPCDHMAGRTFIAAEVKTISPIFVLHWCIQAIHGCSQPTVDEANPKLPLREGAVRLSSRELNQNWN